MKNRTLTGIVVAIIFAIVAVCSLKVSFIFFDIFVILLMLAGVFEISRAVKQRLGSAVMFLVLYVCCFGYAGFYILINIGKRDPFWGTGVYLMIIASAVLINFLYHFILKKYYEKQQNKPLGTGSDASISATSDASISADSDASTSVESRNNDNLDAGENVQADDSSVTCDEAEAGGQELTTEVAASGEAVARPPIILETSAAATTMTLLYPCILLVFMLSANYLRLSYRGIAIMLIFTVSPLTDVLAYLVGSTLKGKKLCPKISPNKTISGAIGGLVGGTLGGLIVFLLTQSPVYSWLYGNGGELGSGHLIHCLILGFGGSLFTQAGDLFASFVKRKCQIKDFGHLLPGHGGVIDRIDGMIFNATFIFVYITIFISVVHG